MTEKSIENYYQIMKANRRLPWKSSIKKNCILVFGVIIFQAAIPLKFQQRILLMTL